MSEDHKNNVEVKESTIAGAGRGLFVCQDFAPGDVVVFLDRPLVAELEVHHMRDTCAWCFQRGATDPVERMQAASMGLPNGLIEIKNCTGCRRVGYCSKTCQSRAWKREHKYECKILAPKERPDLPLQVRAVIKLLGRLQASSGAERERILDILEFWPTGKGNNHLEDICKYDKQKYDDFHMLANAAWHYSGMPALKGLDAQTVAKGFLFNVMCNVFRLSSPLDAAHYGSGFDPITCTANHSCDPNAVLYFNQPSSAMRALKPIKKGEEIFVGYTESTNPFWVRQSYLKETYFFTCQCPKCAKCPVFPEDTWAKRPEDLSEEYCSVADSLIKSHKAELSKFLIGTNESTAQLRLAAMQASVFAVSDNDQSTEEELKSALDMCISSGMWTWTRQPVLELCRRLFSTYMESGNTYKAFRLGCKMHFELLPAFHPQPFYPERLIIAWTLITMSVVLSGPMHSEVYKELAQNGLNLRIIFYGFLFYVCDHIPQLYGWNSPFGRIIENTYKQAMAGTDLSKDEIREKVNKIWPTLEAFSRSLDIISLCNPSESAGRGII